MYRTVIIVCVSLAIGFCGHMLLISPSQTKPVTVPKSLHIESALTQMQVFIIIGGTEIRGFFTKEKAAKKYVEEHEGAYIFPFGVSPTIDLQMEFAVGDNGKLQAKLLNW